ncbi:hypothetical protein ABIC08_009195 [Bradyrhizobium sp. RT9b]|uniref:hypothetical protein n=1 Tax=unclassified Bradyrhizobium TaxID=2631580 RepID=UPI003396B0A1
MPASPIATLKLMLVLLLAMMMPRMMPVIMFINMPTGSIMLIIIMVPPMIGTGYAGFVLVEPER